MSYVRYWKSMFAPLQSIKKYMALKYARNAKNKMKTKKSVFLPLVVI